MFHAFAQRFYVLCANFGAITPKAARPLTNPPLQHQKAAPESLNLSEEP